MRWYSERGGDWEYARRSTTPAYPSTSSRARRPGPGGLLSSFTPVLVQLGYGRGLWRVIVCAVASGLGTGVLNAVLGREAVVAVPPDLAAMGSGATNTARYLGAAIGITFTLTLTSDTVVEGWDVAVPVTAAITLLGAALIALGGRRAA